MLDQQRHHGVHGRVVVGIEPQFAEPLVLADEVGRRIGELPEQRYVDALIADLEAALPLIWGRKIYTIFFGGGTPSVLSADSIERILSAVRARVPLSLDAEITLEANPGTFEIGRAHV